MAWGGHLWKRQHALDRFCLLLPHSHRCMPLDVATRMADDPARAFPVPTCVAFQYFDPPINEYELFLNLPPGSTEVKQREVTLQNSQLKAHFYRKIQEIPINSPLNTNEPV